MATQSSNGQKAVLIIMILALIGVFFLLIGRNTLKINERNGRETIERLELKNQNLQESLYNCRLHGTELERQIDSLKALIPIAKAPTSIAQVTRPVKPADNRLIIDVRVIDQREAPVRQVYQEPVMTKASAPEARTAFISNDIETAFPSFYYEEKVIKMCLRLGEDDNRHLPHLGIFDGIIAQDNGISGYNWVLTPTETIIGDWGITTDGTFYVSTKLVDKYITKSDKGLVEIKAPATNWLPVAMVRNGGYYTYKKVM